MALLAATSFGFSESLMVKRSGGTDPVELELASQGVNTEGGSAARFVELSHAAHDNDKVSPTGCIEGGCTFLQDASGGFKTLKQQKKKRAKKLQKAVKLAKKDYLRNHTEEDYNILKLQSVLDGLERENYNGGMEYGNGEEA